MFPLDQLINRAIQQDVKGVRRLSLVAILQALLVARGETYGGIGVDGLLGGAAAGRGGCTGLNQGWTGLIERFRQAGFGDDADMLAGTGSGKTVSPITLETVLGEGTVTSLANFADVDRSHLLNALGVALPSVVSQLKASGHAPVSPEAISAESRSRDSL